MWWVLGFFVEVLFGQQRQRDVGNVVSNNLSRWIGWTNALLTDVCAIRRGIDNMGRDKAWHWLLLEPCASTTGLLAWLVSCCCFCRDAVPELAFEVLHALLSHFLGALDFVLQFPMSKDAPLAFVVMGSVSHPQEGP